MNTKLLEYDEKYDINELEKKINDIFRENFLLKKSLKDIITQNENERTEERKRIARTVKADKSIIDLYEREYPTKCESSG